MVAPALPPLNVESGRGSGRRRRTRRRGTRTPPLFPAPSLNPVAEVPEAVLELRMLAGDDGLLPPPDAVVVADMSLSTLSHARPSPGLSARGPWRVPRSAAFASPPGGEGAGLCLVRRYLTSALGRRALLANRDGKVRNWRSLLANSQSRRLFYYQSKKISRRRRRRCRKGMEATSLNRRWDSNLEQYILPSFAVWKPSFKSVAQMGWVLVPIALIACAYITYLLHRRPHLRLLPLARTHPLQTKLHLYMDAVRSCLGPRDVAMCGTAQYTIVYASQFPQASCGGQQLPLLKGPRRELQPGWDDVPGDVRPRRGRPLVVARPGDRSPSSPSSPPSCPSPTLSSHSS